jgi:hypothetical protein
MSGWWIVPSQGLVTVDDAPLKGIDCSSVPANIYLIRWWGTRGEILYNHNDRLPVREKFIDITPYVPLFNQWMNFAELPPSPSPPITLAQAKTVKIDMINALFDSKRQAPYHYPVASGDYWWDATDATMFSSLVPAVENLVAKANEIAASLNQLAANLNSAIPGLNSADGTITNNVNNNATIGNSLRDNVNSFIVTPGRDLFNEFNTVVVPADSARALTTSQGLQTGTFLIGSINTALAAPGLSGYLPTLPTFTAAADPSYISVTFGTFTLPGVPWTPIANVANVASTSMSWIPIGSTTPANVTPAEQQAIIEGITARTNQLNLIANQKTAQVNALTTVAAVVAYDVLAGWPVVPLPPGYTQRSTELEPQRWAAPAVTAGVPEAPSDGITYGRRNAIWNPALALTGDILDGGNF